MKQTKSWKANVTPWTPKQACVDVVNKAIFGMRLDAAGRRYIANAIKMGPSRRVQSARGNVITRFTSSKMNTQVLLESRRGELPLAVLAEADPKVIAFFAQPDAVELELKDETGKVQSRIRYTPDLLTITATEVIALQARDLTDLSAAHLKNPFQFYSKGGEWHYRAADEALERFGIRHKIVDNSSIPAVLVRNIRFLEDYTRVETPPLDPKIGESIAAYVLARRVVSLQELVREAKFNVEDIYKLILLKGVYVDLQSQLLDVSHDLHIYSDEATCVAHQAVTSVSLETPIPIPGRAWIRSGAKLTYDGVTFTVILVGERDVLVRDPAGNDTTLQLQALQNLRMRAANPC